MRRAKSRFAAAAAAGLAVALACSGTAAAEDPTAEDSTAEDPGAVARGAYLLAAAGCLACHTDEKGGGAPLAGGRALETPFGTFYTPNITPDGDDGLGAWSEADFLRALSRGRGPEGQPYYPAFPYTSYSGMSAGDMKDLWSYLKSVPPVAQANRRHALDFPFNIRLLAGVWQSLFFHGAAFRPDAGRDEAWNRGAYLVRHLGHCGECHSPRGALGAVDGARELAGNPEGPEGKRVPNITPHEDDGVGGWSTIDLTYFLKTGFLPDGDVAGGAMDDVIRESAGKLTDEDRAAIAAYLATLPPLPGPPKAPR